MGNTEVDMKVLVPVYSKEYQEQKRFTIGELPEVFRHVRSVHVDGEYIIIVYGRTATTIGNLMLR